MKIKIQSSSERNILSSNESRNSKIKKIEFWFHPIDQNKITSIHKHIQTIILLLFYIKTHIHCKNVDLPKQKYLWDPHHLDKQWHMREMMDKLLVPEEIVFAKEHTIIERIHHIFGTIVTANNDCKQRSCIKIKLHVNNECRYKFSTQGNVRNEVR